MLQCHLPATTSALPALPGETGRQTLDLVASVYGCEMRIRQRPGGQPTLSVLGPPHRATAAKDRVRELMDWQSGLASPPRPFVFTGRHLELLSFGVEQLTPRLARQAKANRGAVPDEQLHEALQEAEWDTAVDRVAFIVDVRSFPDPERVYGHIGLHPGIVSGIVRHPVFFSTLCMVKDSLRALETVDQRSAALRLLPEPQRRRPEVGITRVAFFCRSGRHRSVAWVAIMEAILRGHCERVTTQHHSYYSGAWRHLCPRDCELCWQPNASREQALLLARAMWEGI